MRIPGHGTFGLTPQSIIKFGTYNGKGKRRREARKLLDELPKTIEKMGCFGIVPWKKSLPIGQGGLQKVSPSNSYNRPLGRKCVDGQVLVNFNDLLGMYPEFNPRFLRRYLKQLYEEMVVHFQEMSIDVKTRDFPRLTKSILKTISLRLHYRNASHVMYLIWLLN